MTFIQLIAKLKSATSFFALGGISPADMGAAFQQVENRLDAVEAIVRMLQSRTSPPSEPKP